MIRAALVLWALTSAAQVAAEVLSICNVCQGVRFVRERVEGGHTTNTIQVWCPGKLEPYFSVADCQDARVTLAEGRYTLSCRFGNAFSFTPRLSQ